jgi:hypothetical protein
MEVEQLEARAIERQRVDVETGCPVVTLNGSLARRPRGVSSFSDATAIAPHNSGTIRPSSSPPCASIVACIRHPSLRRDTTHSAARQNARFARQMQEPLKALLSGAGTSAVVLCEIKSPRAISRSSASASVTALPARKLPWSCPSGVKMRTIDPAAPSRLKI